MPIQKINVCHSAHIFKVLSACLNSQGCFGGQCLQKYTVYNSEMPSLNLHCCCFDVHTKKGLEISILDLSKHSIKMATTQKEIPNPMAAQSKRPPVNSVMFSFQSKDHKGPVNKQSKKVFSCLYSSSCQFFQTPEKKPYMPLKNIAVATGTLKEPKIMSTK